MIVLSSSTLAVLPLLVGLSLAPGCQSDSAEAPPSATLDVVALRDVTYVYETTWPDIADAADVAAAQADALDVVAPDDLDVPEPAPDVLEAPIDLVEPYDPGPEPEDVPALAPDAPDVPPPPPCLDPCPGACLLGVCAIGCGSLVEPTAWSLDVATSDGAPVAVLCADDVDFALPYVAARHLAALGTTAMIELSVEIGFAPGDKPLGPTGFSLRRRDLGSNQTQSVGYVSLGKLLPAGAAFTAGPLAVSPDGALAAFPFGPTEEPAPGAE